MEKVYIYRFFSDLKSGRCSSTVEVRLLRTWEARNPRRGGELMWIDMLMVHVNATIMQASIDASQAVFCSMLLLARLFDIYFDNESSSGETFFYFLVARDTGLPPAAPLLKGYAKVESLTIAEFNAFIITAPGQVFKFIWRIVDISRVLQYVVDVACSKCAKKRQRTGNSFACERCVNAHIVGSLRYRVEMVIADDTAKGVFVCFDGVMTKLHNLKANEAGQMLTHIPPFRREYTFQVRVSEYNFIVNHQTFTITHILKEGDCPPDPDFVDNGGNGSHGNDGADSKQFFAGLGSGGISGGLATANVSSLTGGAPGDYPGSSSTVGKKARLA
ncbi:unnamed protein product [Eruca vesicaria subsp. sativa]|uniref:Replication factor A C-terminal domain-containing protein n=1 Tax=Eruca vesicaria subsp. sativa TaxID=29727 RepID=A0ABC8IWN3_ERUVS|nr:unnamed protein product [Eruca vesicaria subsp. sativa]